jgi:hypothetical protein
MMKAGLATTVAPVALAIGETTRLIATSSI